EMYTSVAQAGNVWWVSTLSGALYYRAGILRWRLARYPTGGRARGFVDALIPAGRTVWGRTHFGVLIRGSELGWEEAGVAEEVAGITADDAASVVVTVARAEGAELRT